MIKQIQSEKGSGTAQAEYRTEIAMKMKRWISALIILILLFTALPSGITASGAGAWDGTSVSAPETDSSGTYLITCAEELAWIAVQTANGETFSTASFRLTADIDLGSQEWTPIGGNGSVTKYFCGSFDGNGFSISNLSVNSTKSYIALFGCTGAGAVIQNLTISSGHITGNGYVAAFVGQARGITTVQNCVNNASITYTNTASSPAGGIMAHSYAVGTKITDCINNGDVTASSTGTRAGGIVGIGRADTSVTNCSNTGTISASAYAGGIAGINYCTVTASYNTGAVSGASYAGGIAGDNYTGGVLQACYNLGTVSAENTAGGIAGRSFAATSEIRGCYNAGILTAGGENIGQILGLFTAGNVTNAYGSDLYPVPAVGSVEIDGAVNLEDAVLKESASLLDSERFTNIHYFNGGYPVLIYVLGGNDHSVLDAAFVTGSELNEQITSEELNHLLNQIKAHGIYATQDEIDTVAAELNLIIDSFSDEDADYSGVDSAIQTARTALANPEYPYTQSSIDAVNRAIDAVIRGYLKPDQALVNAMAQNILDAVANLTYQSALIPVENAGALIDKERGYIYGIAEGTESLDAYVRAIGDCTVEYDTGNWGFGTGTVLRLVENGVTIESYTVVLFGDINGDGFVDAFDAASILYMANNAETAGKDPLTFAADLDCSGYIDVYDVALIISAANLEYTVDQAQTAGNYQ